MRPSSLGVRDITWRTQNGKSPEPCHIGKHSIQPRGRAIRLRSMRMTQAKSLEETLRIRAVRCPGPRLVGIFGAGAMGWDR